MEEGLFLYLQSNWLYNDTFASSWWLKFSFVSKKKEMYGIDPNCAKINGKNAFNLSRMNQVLVEQRQKERKQNNIFESFIWVAIKKMYSMNTFSNMHEFIRSILSETIQWPALCKVSQ